MELMKIEDLRLTKTLFDCIMDQVQSNFSEENIIKGFENAGFSHEDYWAQYPLGRSQLFEEIEQYLDKMLTLPSDLENASLSKKVKWLTAERIKIAQNYKESLISIYSYFNKPHRMHIKIKAMIKSVMNIWIICADFDESFSYYSKRAILMLIYKRGLSKALSDKNWEEFLEKAFNHVSKIGKIKSRFNR
jgi:rpsU-divergently transcribed protein